MLPADGAGAAPHEPCLECSPAEGRASCLALTTQHWPMPGSTSRGYRYIMIPPGSTVPSDAVDRPHRVVQAVTLDFKGRRALAAVLRVGAAAWLLAVA